MRPLKTLLIVMLSACALSAGIMADPFRQGDGLTLVWVTIKAKPNEGLWEACRRVYQHDVYQVRRGPGSAIRCNIDHSRLYDFGERRQNFNRSNR